jgi:type IV pilus assembly protein PilX
MITDTCGLQPGYRQQGVALIMAMVFLMILTIIGVTVMSTTSLQEKMAGNVQDKHSAFQAAESALRDGEAVIETWTPATRPDFSLNTGGYYMPQPGTTAPWWETVVWDPAGSEANQLATTIDGVIKQPTYIVEDLGQLPSASGGTGSLVTGFAPPSAVAGGANMYRITARGVGRSDSAVAVVQSVYRK